MKALVKLGPGKGLSYQEVEKPKIKDPKDVLVNIKAVSICGSDLPIYYWTEWGVRAMEHAEYPAILGHEASGSVVEVGEGVKEVKVGDRIVINSCFYCGRCFYCRQGLDNLCENRVLFGKKTGAFAEYTVIPEIAAIKLPDRMSYEEGALLELLGVAIHGVNQGDLHPGDFAAVLGCGPIGLLAIKYLELIGAVVIATQRGDYRLKLAQRMGGDAVIIDVKKEDPVPKILDLTDGRGADFVYEATGNPTVLQQALDIARNGAKIVTIGTFPKPVPIDVFFKISRKELTLRGSLGRTWRDWQRAIDLVATGKLDVTSIITHRFSLAEFEKAFEVLHSKKAGKIILYL